MTPLAHHLAKQLTLPIKRRINFWPNNSTAISTLLTDIHCFEVTEVLPLMEEMREALAARAATERDEMLARLVFLPAPRTWIEMRLLDDRFACLFEESKDEQKADVILLSEGSASPLGSVSLTTDDVSVAAGLKGFPNVPLFQHMIKAMGASQTALELLGFAQLAIILINSPQIIGRRQHMPHRGLERSLVAATKAFGKFPLHAWTEIKLDVAKPIDIDDGEPHEAHLTGRRALHFCRKHLRVRYGRLEYVRAHWRGDAALGIKQSRYRVVA